MITFTVVYLIVGFVIFHRKYKNETWDTSYEKSMYSITLMAFLLFWPLYLCIHYIRKKWMVK